ncbi:hypothetical protein BDQ17DRAFT_1342013 [Cyathus striatus]|nr:hypothetical protein BDQ17DRAFT_1342013 [Cyathus striatus]
MLLKFTAADMLNTSLIDVTTGERAYEIVTIMIPSEAAESLLATSGSEISSPPSPVDAVPPTSQYASTSKSAEQARRRTQILDPSGNILVDIIWNGRQPSITIGDEKVGALTDLFGSSTIRFMPKILCIPTRFDTEYIWTATADSLTLYDYDADLVKGTFHQNVIRLRASKLRQNSSSSSRTLYPRTDSAFRFLQTHIPGFGSNYLEFKPHFLALDVEIIISFLMMEILRRGRFCLTPYTFDRSRLWHLKEAKDRVVRRLRRYTM